MEKNTPIEVVPSMRIPLVKDNKYSKHLTLIEKKRKSERNHFQFESFTGVLYGALLDRQIEKEARTREQNYYPRRVEETDEEQDGARCWEPAYNDDDIPRFGEPETFTGINWNLYPPARHSPLEIFDIDKFNRRMRLLTEYGYDTQHLLTQIKK